MNAKFEKLLKLGRAERLQLVEDLWGSDAHQPVSDGKRAELRKRKAPFLQQPSSALTWEQVKQNARTKNGQPPGLGVPIS